MPSPQSTNLTSDSKASQTSLRKHAERPNLITIRAKVADAPTSSGVSSYSIVGGFYWIVGSVLGSGRARDVKGEAKIEKSLLKSHYFEARFARWQNEGTPLEISLDLPHGCLAAAGLRLFHLRIKDEAAVWNYAQWWKAADGVDAALLSALHLFDLVLDQPHCLEVASAVGRLNIPVSEPTLSIAQKLVPTIRAVRYPKIDTDRDSFKRILHSAAIGDVDTRTLADRLIAAVPDAQLLLALVEEFKLCKLQQHLDRAAPWLTFHIHAVVKRWPSAAKEVFSSMGPEEHARQQKLMPVLKSFSWTSEEARHFCNLMYVCMDSLLLQSSTSWVSKYDLLGLIESMELVGTARVCSSTSAAAMLKWPVESFQNAPADVQASILRMKHCPVSLRALLTGRAHIVAFEARKWLLPLIHLMTEEDRVFVSKADFPLSHPLVHPSVLCDCSLLILLLWFGSQLVRKTRQADAAPTAVSNSVEPVKPTMPAGIATIVLSKLIEALS